MRHHGHDLRPLFPTIFATASVQDEHLSLQRDIMIVSTSGGTMFPLADGISKRAETGKRTTSAFFLMPGGFTIVASYILAINTCRKTKTEETRSRPCQGQRN